MKRKARLGTQRTGCGVFASAKRRGKRLAVVGAVSAIVSAVILAPLFLGQAAQAQSFGTARILRPRAEQGEKARPNYVSLAPVVFVGIDNRNEQTRTSQAGVLGYERGLNLRSEKSAAQVGLFAYQQNSSTLFVGQAKYYINRSFGLQGSILKGTKGGDADTAVFALYNLSTRTFDPQARIPWDFQLGLGGYFPGDRSPTSPNSFSGFGQLTFSVTKTVSVNASYWGISTGHSSTINRFLVGAGLAF